MKLKKLALIALSSAVLFTGISSFIASGAHAEYTATSNQNWMEQVNNQNPSFKNSRIRDVLLPGTHDSGTATFGMGGNVKASPDSNPIVQAGNQLTKDSKRNQVIRQDNLIADQLNHGIRYLDLRVAPYNNGDPGGVENFNQYDLRIVHDLYGEKVEDMLAATSNFLSNNSKEILILDFQHFYTMDSTGYSHLKSLIENYLGIWLVNKNQFGPTSTLNDLWSANKRVFVLFGTDHGPWTYDWSSAGYNSSTADALTKANNSNKSWIFTRNENIVSNWYAKNNINDHITALDQDTLQNVDPNKFHVVQDVMAGATRGSAIDANAFALNRLQGSWMNRSLNIIMVDFYNNCDLVNVIKRLNTSNRPDGDNAPGVYVNADPNLSGAGNRLLGDVDDLGKGNGYDAGNDKITSVQIVGPYTVELFTESNYRGDRLQLSGSEVTNLNVSYPSFNDTISSIRITRTDEASGVFLYDDTDFKGKRIRLTGDEPNLALTSLGHDKAASIQFVGNYQVQVYDDANYTGNTGSWTSSQSNLGDWNDRASSIKITPITDTSGVYIYQDLNYSGQSLRLTSSVNSLPAGWDNKVSSINIVGNYYVTLWSVLNTGAGGTGHYYEVKDPAVLKDLTKVVWDNNNSTLDDNISSMYIQDMRKQPQDYVNLDANALQITYSGTDGANYVTSNVELPSIGASGSTITWTSSNPQVISAANGTVILPQKPITPVQLTAKIEYGSANTTKTYNLSVINASLVTADYNALQIQYAGSDNANSVTSNVTLPTVGKNGTPITWSSSYTPVISTNGTVTPSNFGSTKVTLTATLLPGLVKSFDLVVADGIVVTDRNALSIGYAAGESETKVLSRLTLPTRGLNGSTITWTSSHSSVVSVNGVVTNPTTDTNVTLTATVSKGAGPSLTKSFVVTVAGTTIVLNGENPTRTNGTGYAGALGSGWTGTGYWNFNNTTGFYVDYDVNVVSAGTYNINFRYANGDTKNRMMSVLVDSVGATQVFTSTGSWNTNWGDVNITVSLTAGTHTIRVAPLDATGAAGVNLDKITVVKQ